MTTRIKYNRKKIDSGEAVYIGRGFRYHNIPRSKWHNPFTVKEYGRNKAIELYREYIKDHDISELVGKTLCCHCQVDEPCHGDVLIKMANG